MIDAYERVVSRLPFVVRRRVRWSDCDPAGVVYTGRFTEYLLDAVQLFFRTLADGPYDAWLQTLGIDTPCKAMSFVFHAALRPEDEFDMTCTVAVVREHSFDIAFEAVQVGGRAIFSARFSPVCIRRHVRERTHIPPDLRNALRLHQPA